MTVRFYEDTRRSRFYGYGPTQTPFASGGVGTGHTMGVYFYMTAPGVIEGVRIWNVMPGNPTLRVGLFINTSGAGGVESVAQTREHAACPLGLQDLAFATPYTATWSDLQFQRNASWGTSFIAVVFDTAGAAGFYQMDTGGKSCLASGFGSTNYGSLGRCYYMAQWSAHTGGTGWVCPPTGGNISPAFDPIILATPFADWSTGGYECFHWPYLHGAGHPTIALGAAAISKTMGSHFWVRKRGTQIVGVRFYTHDPNPWTAKCCLWRRNNGAPVLLASNTVNCTGTGIYDCLFALPVTIDASIFDIQRAGGWWGDGDEFVATVYNQTNVNYTYTNTTWVLPVGPPAPMLDLLQHGYGGGTYCAPIYYSNPAADGFPKTIAAEVYPITPLALEP